MRVRDVSESWGEAGPPASRGEEAPILPRLLLGLRRRAFLILFLWASAIGIAGLVASLRPRHYRAEAMLEIRPEQPLIADPGDPSMAANIPLWENYFRTQVSLLGSRKLLELALERVSPEIAESYRAHGDPLRTLESQLEVEAVPSTFILRVALTHPSPQQGPELVNALVRGYLEEATGRWRELKADAAEILDRETLPALQRKMEEADRALLRFQRETGYADFDQQYASLLESGRTLSGQLLEVRLKRVRCETEREALAKEEAGAPASLFEPAIQKTHALEPLVAQRSALATELAAARLIYKEQHPRIESLRRQLSEVESSIRGIVRAAGDSLGRELRSSLVEEDLLTREKLAVEKQMAEARLERSRYRTLEAEASAAKETYNAYVKKADDTKATSKGGLASVRVIDFAHSPARPSERSRLFLTVGAVLGLVLGLSAALVAEEIDDRITTPRDVEISLGLPVLGLLPRLSAGRRPPARAPLVFQEDPGSLTFEVLRMLRAEVTGRLDRVRRGRVVAVAAPGYGEGKSTVAINLARVLAMEDRRVLLIDGDLRRPQLKALLARRKGMGLEEYLRGERDLHGSVQPSRLALVDVIGAEQPLDRPGEVAGSDRFRELLKEARQRYEYVLIDAGAANLISEVAAYARQADGTLLVLDHGQTRRRAVRLARRRLEGARLLGAVLNRIPARTMELGLREPDISPDVQEALESDGDLVAIVEQELFSASGPPPGQAGTPQED